MAVLARHRDLVSCPFFRDRQFTFSPLSQQDVYILCIGDAKVIVEHEPPQDTPEEA